MRHKNLLEFTNPKTQQTDYLKLLQAIFRFGYPWYQEVQAQETLLGPLNKYLDSRFTLIRNLQIPEIPTPLPPVLVGPSGVFLLYTSPRKGYFRAREDAWEIMHARSRRFRRANPNLVQLALGMARALESHLQQHLGEKIPVQPLLILTDPEAIVDTIRPKVRVVMMDGLENVVRQLSQMRAELSAERIEQILDLLLPSSTAQVQSGPQKPTRTPPPALQKAERAIQQQTQRAAQIFNFTPKQWAVLGILALFNMLILVAFILYVLLTT